MPNPSTEAYVAVIETPPIKSLASFRLDVIAFQGTVPLYQAELSMETVPLQNATMTETDPALVGPLANAYQRTQFLQSRLERVAALLQEVRVGLNDLETDQTAVIAGGYPPRVGMGGTP